MKPTICLVLQFSILLLGDFYVLDRSYGAGGPVDSRSQNLALEERRTKGGSATWVDSTVNGNLAYFAFAFPPRIERYDLESEVWLEPVILLEFPHAIAVDNSGIYVAYRQRVIRVDSGVEVSLLSTTEEIESIFLIGAFLYVHWGANNFTSCFKATGAFIATVEYFSDVSGLSVAPGLNRVFARSTDRSPSDIFRIILNEGGAFGGSGESPYHGEYPDATQTFVFPDETRVADNSGIVYSTENLNYVNSLAGPFTDLAFIGASPITLRNDTLYSYTNSFAEIGRYTLPFACLEIITHGNTIFAAYPLEPRGVEMEIVRADQLTPLQPGPPLDPNGLVYEPHDAFVDNAGILHLLSPENRSIFRWSPDLTAYLSSISLVEEADEMAYSPNTNRVYLGHETGKITQIDLNDENASETPFANSPQTVLELATAREFVFVSDLSQRKSHIIYSPDGMRIAQRGRNHLSEEFVWSANNGRIYFFKDGERPNNLLWEIIQADGTFGTSRESPDHSGDDIEHPIRVAPNGSYVVLGSGRVHEGISLQTLGFLPNEISDLTWAEITTASATPYTLRSTEAGSQVQKINTEFQVSGTAPVQGSPLRILRVNDRLIVMTSVSGVPVFNLFDEALQVIYSGIIPTPGPTFTPTETLSPTATATLTPQPEDINRDGYINPEDLFRILKLWHRGWKEQ